MLGTDGRAAREQGRFGLQTSVMRAGDRGHEGRRDTWPSGGVAQGVPNRARDLVDTTDGDQAAALVETIALEDFVEQ
jgi:hypothetical protein